MNKRKLISARFHEEMKRADKFMLMMMGVHFVAAWTVIPLAEGNAYTLGLVGGGLIAGLAALIYHFYKGTMICRIGMGVLLMAFSALYIQQNNGLIETHFHIFGAMAFLLIYRDWRVILAAVTTVAVHHILFGILQYNEVQFFGTPLLAYSNGCTVGIVVIHACWALFEACVLMFYSRSLKRDFLTNINFTEQMKFLADNPSHISQPFTSFTNSAEEQSFLGPVNDFLGNMSKVILETDNSSQTLDGCSNRLLETSEQMNRVAVTLDGKAESAAKSVRQMADTVHTTAVSAEQTNKGVQLVSQTAASMAENAQLVSANANEVSTNINMVMNAINELETSISEVAISCSQAAEASEAGNRQAYEAGEQVASLNEGAKKIGDVVNLIRNIAAHTNLLALNSTIEAASAGEAGKGFAVVANEIKMLAKQTADATDEIARQVEKIQRDSHSSHDKMEKVAGMIANLSELMTTVASAVEQQSASTSEIAGSISSGAEATKELNDRIHSINDGAKDLASRISAMASDTQNIAQAMEQISSTTRSYNDDTEEMGRLAHEAALSSESVKSETEGMTGLSRELAGGVSQFRTEEAAA